MQQAISEFKPFWGDFDGGDAAMGPWSKGCKPARGGWQGLINSIRGDGASLKAAEGWSAAGKLPENQKYGLGVSRPVDMVSILEKLERGEIVSPAASRETLDILKRCQDDTGVRRRLSGVTMANKTGALAALRSEAAVVHAKGGRIAMAITVDRMPKTEYTPDNAGSLLIADLARILVDGLARHYIDTIRGMRENGSFGIRAEAGSWRRRFRLQ